MDQRFGSVQGPGEEGCFAVHVGTVSPLRALPNIVPSGFLFVLKFQIAKLNPAHNLHCNTRVLGVLLFGSSGNLGAQHFRSLAQPFVYRFVRRAPGVLGVRSRVFCIQGLY